MTLGRYLIRADLDACQCENAETTEKERCLAQILPAHAALRGPPQHEAAAHAAAQAPGRRQVHHHRRHRAVAVPVSHQLVHLQKYLQCRKYILLLVYTYEEVERRVDPQGTESRGYEEDLDGFAFQA